MAEGSGYVWFGEVEAEGQPHGSLTASGGGEGEREVLSSSTWDPVVGSMGMVRSCLTVGIDWVLGSTSVPRTWSNTGTGFLGR